MVGPEGIPKSFRAGQWPVKDFQESFSPARCALKDFQQDFKAHRTALKDFQKSFRALGGWVDGLAGISACLERWRPDVVSHLGGIKYMFDFLHARMCKDRHQAP